MKSLKEIVTQLKDCGFTCEAGPLENNVDFRLLAELADVDLPRTMSEALAEIGVKTKDLGFALSQAMRVVKSPQQQRDEIIEKAKCVESGLKRDWYGQHRFLFNNYVCDAEFFVNKEKRTVVAILRHKFDGIVSRGIAKADPSDCFNVHIGKAIALRRALGLEVPAEYLNAPQPTEVRVGDVVEGTNFPQKYTVERFCDDEITIRSFGRPFRMVENSGWIGVNQVKIIDDSRE
jgi:hypothetical protein